MQSFRYLGLIYAFPAFSFMAGFGDPHLINFDGVVLTFNGHGEYWLIKSPVLQVQARTSQAADAVSGAPVNASIFTAFAIQVPEAVGQNLSDRVVVLMTSSTRELDCCCYFILEYHCCEILWLRLK